MAHNNINSSFAGSSNKGLQAGHITGDVVSHFHQPAERRETPPPPSDNIPFPQDADFIEREHILEQLESKFALPAARIALVGIGGVGKSQLAIEYGYRVRKRSKETWVFWVHAGSTARFEQSFRDLVECACIPGRNDPGANIFKLVRNWLRSERSGRWFLILDNVDEMLFLGKMQDGQQTATLEPITTYFPPCSHGSILVTSRSNSVALNLVEERDAIAVDTMDEGHALKLMKKKLGTLSGSSHVPELAEALEYMPLAIVQAAAYISQRAPLVTVEQYLKKFIESDHGKTSLLDQDGGKLRRDWEARDSIILTWQLSFEYIHEIRASAADLLSLMSFCDRQGIPDSLLRNRSTAKAFKLSSDKDSKRSKQTEDRERLEEDVRVLKNYRFVSITSDHTFGMHALVQSATRIWLNANGQLEDWRYCYIRNLEAQFPSGKYEHWSICQALLPHAKSAIAQRPQGNVPLLYWAELLYRIAWYEFEIGNFAEAIELAEKSRSVRQDILGPENPETLHSMFVKAQAYVRHGRWAEAEALHTQVLEIRQKKLGETAPDTLSSMVDLASLNFRQNRLKKAEELELFVLKIQEDKLGSEAPETVSIRSKLASTYARQNRLEEAVKIQLSVLESYRTRLGEEHPETLLSMSNLAATYSDKNQLEDSEELRATVLRVRKKVLGNEHPRTLSSMASLASTYRQQKRSKEAEVLYLQALAIFKRKLGEEHYTTLHIMHDLARTWKDQGRDGEAIALMTECLDSQTKVLGASHYDTRRSAGRLNAWQHPEAKRSFGDRTMLKAKPSSSAGSERSKD